MQPFAGSPALGAEASASFTAGLPENLPSNLLDIDIQIQAELEAKWDDMSESARVAACERLKDEFPNDQAVQGMDCKSTSLRNAFRVAGYAAGVAICSASGVGTAAANWACGPMGAWLANTFYDELVELNLRFGLSGLITGGWADMSTWQRYNWCYRESAFLAPDGVVYDFPGERKWYIDRYGRPAYESRCSGEFPGFVPQYLTARQRIRMAAMSPAQRAAYAQAVKSSGAADRPWYKSPWTWLGALVLAGGTTVAVRRRRRKS
jgi:hypothetical protein